jgi:hypothetical protein
MVEFKAVTQFKLSLDNLFQEWQLVSIKNILIINIF